MVPICPEGKGDRCGGFETLPASYADCLEIWEPQPPGTLRACPGLYMDCFAFYVAKCKYTFTRRHCVTSQKKNFVEFQAQLSTRYGGTVQCHTKESCNNVPPYNAFKHLQIFSLRIKRKELNCRLQGEHTVFVSRQGMLLSRNDMIWYIS